MLTELIWRPNLTTERQAFHKRNHEGDRQELVP